MAALISSVMETKDKVPFYVNECAEMGIEVLPPDVNSSGEDFAVVEGRIRFGLSAVKSVGESAVRAIVQAREEGGPFTTLWDFCERVDASRSTSACSRASSSAAALDSTGATRGAMLAVARGGGRLGPEGAGRRARAARARSSTSARAARTSRSATTRP